MTRLVDARGGGVPSGRQGLVPPSRYRHPGDVLWLIAAGLFLLLVLAASVVASDALWGPDAAVVAGAEPDTAVGRLLVGVVQLIAVLVPVLAVGALLWFRRFRLLATSVGTAVAAAAAWAGLVLLLLSSDGPARLEASRGSAGWLFGAGFPGPAAVAAAVGVTLAAGPWLSLSWRRVAWLVVGLSAVAELVAGVALPIELVLAFAVGAVVGAGVLVALGAPDRRIDEEAVAEVLGAAGLTVRSVRRAEVETKGSWPFVVTLADGDRRFVKALGRDQRHADLLYRGYRLAWLRGVGDVPPASSLKQSVEHQALVGLVAERAAVRVPHVDRLAEASDGSVLLVMQLIDGRSLQDGPMERVTDELLRGLWDQVRCMHGAGIAHRSLRTANVMVDDSCRQWIVDFSFAELMATERQLALDRAELLASTADLVGPDRAVAAAAAVLDRSDLAAAVPLLQPLALSSATRRAIRGEPDLLARTMAAAAAATSAPATELPHLQRVRLKTLLMIAAAAGAFYFVLPQLAQVGSSWRAFRSADWAWVPLLIVLSAVELPGQHRLGPRIGAAAAVSAAHPAQPTGVLVRQPGVAGQHRGDGAQRPVPAEGRDGRGQRSGRGRAQQPGRWDRARGVARRVPGLVPPRPRRRLPPAIGEQAAARAGPPRGDRGCPDRHPLGTAQSAHPSGRRRAQRSSESPSRCSKPGKARAAVPWVGRGDAGVHRRVRRRRAHLRRHRNAGGDGRRLSRRFRDRRSRPDTRWPRAAGGRPHRRPDRHRRRRRRRGIGRSHLPAGHLLATACCPAGCLST